MGLWKEFIELGPSVNFLNRKLSVCFHDRTWTNASPWGFFSQWGQKAYWFLGSNPLSPPPTQPKVIVHPAPQYPAEVETLVNFGSLLRCCICPVLRRTGSCKTAITSKAEIQSTDTVLAAPWLATLQGLWLHERPLANTALGAQNSVV